GCDSKTCGTSTTAVPGLYLNIGTPDSTGTLHFLDATGTGQDLTKLIKIADTPTGSPDTLFSVVSMDSGRNLVAVWCISSSTPANRQVFVSAASAASGWASWTKPVQVSDASMTTGDAVNVFPWIKAGGPGRADAVSYGLVQPGFAPGVLILNNGQQVQLIDHKGAGVITIARQSSGTGLFGTAVSGPSNAPVGGLTDPTGEALFPVIGGNNQRGMDIRWSRLELSRDGHTLNVTMQVSDPSNPGLSAARL